MSDFYSKWYKTPSTKGTSKMSDEQKKKRKQDLYNAALERDAAASSYSKNYDTQTISDATKLWAKSNVATGSKKYSSYDKIANSVDKKVQAESKKRYDDWLKLGSYDKERAKSLGIDTSKPFNKSDITMAKRLKAFNDAKEVKAKKNEPNKAIKGFDNLIDKGLKKSAPTLQKIGKGISKTSDFMEKNDSVTKDILDALSWAGEKVIRPTMNVANNLTDDKKGVQLLQALKDGVKKDGKQKSTGEDVFRNLGVDGKYLPKILGSGTEMLLDPTNLIPLGMVRKVDKVKDVAKATTVVDDAIKQVEQSNLPQPQKEVAKQHVVENAQPSKHQQQLDEVNSRIAKLEEDMKDVQHVPRLARTLQEQLDSARNWRNTLLQRQQGTGATESTTQPLLLNAPQENPRAVLQDIEQVLQSTDRAKVISERLNAKFQKQADDTLNWIDNQAVAMQGDGFKQPTRVPQNPEELARQLQEQRNPSIDGRTQSYYQQRLEEITPQLRQPVRGNDVVENIPPSREQYLQNVVDTFPNREHQGKAQNLEEFGRDLALMDSNQLKMKETPRKATNIEEEVAALQDKRDGIAEEVEKQFELMKQQLQAKPLQKAGVNRDEMGNVVGRNGTTSGKPSWAVEFYKANNRYPNQTELKQMARDFVRNGFTENGVNVPSVKDMEAISKIDEQIQQVEDMMKQYPNEREALQPIREALYHEREMALSKGEASATELQLDSITDIPVTDKIKNKAVVENQQPQKELTESDLIDDIKARQELAANNAPKKVTKGANEMDDLEQQWSQLAREDENFTLQQLIDRAHGNDKQPYRNNYGDTLESIPISDKARRANDVFNDADNVEIPKTPSKDMKYIESEVAQVKADLESQGKWVNERSIQQELYNRKVINRDGSLHQDYIQRKADEIASSQTNPLQKLEDLKVSSKKQKQDAKIKWLQSKNLPINEANMKRAEEVFNKRKGKNKGTPATFKKEVMVKDGQIVGGGGTVIDGKVAKNQPIPLNLPIKEQPKTTPSKEVKLPKVKKDNVVNLPPRVSESLSSVEKHIEGLKGFDDAKELVKELEDAKSGLLKLNLQAFASNPVKADEELKRIEQLIKRAKKLQADKNIRTNVNVEKKVQLKIEKNKKAVENRKAIIEEQKQAINTLKKDGKTKEAGILENQVLADEAKLRHEEKKVMDDAERETFVDFMDSWVDLDSKKDLTFRSWNAKTPERVIETIAKTKEAAGHMIYTLIRPIKESEAARKRFVRDTFEKFNKLKMTNDERRFVQMYGEKKITEEQLATQGANVERIKMLTHEFRNFYDGILPTINKSLEARGHDPIPMRKDYFPHFTDEDGLFKELFGISSDDMRLPTSIAGVTDQFNPSKRYFANAKQRKGDQTTFDALAGLEMYVQGASYLIHHTDNIGRLRNFENALLQVLPENSQNLSNFKVWMHEYANTLAGKKGSTDRAIENGINRKWYNVARNLQAKLSQGLMAANVTSALTGIIPLNVMASETSKTAMIKAMKDLYIKDGLRNNSDFLVRRLDGHETLTATKVDKVIDAGFTPFRLIDDFVARLTVRSKYYEGLEKGMTEDYALRYADHYANRLIGDFSSGSRPALFEQKMLAPVTQFQSEVTNQFYYLFKDLPNNYKGNKLKLASVIGQFALYNYLYNSVYEELTGRRPAPDPINVGKNAYEFAKGKPGSGEALYDSVAGQIPFLSFFAEGRTPAFEAIFDVYGVATGEKQFSDEAIQLGNFIPFFNTGKKAVQGLSAWNEGGVYKKDGEGKEQLVFPIEKTPQNFVRSALGGKWSTPEAKRYFEGNYRALTPKMTEELGANPTMDAYVSKQNERNAKSIEEKLKGLPKKDKAEWLKKLETLRLQQQQTYYKE